MTKKEAIENHRKMWLWIAKNTLKSGYILTKNDYFTFSDYEGDIPARKCFCCEAVWCYIKDFTYCDRCPIDFGGYCASKGGLYNKWFNISIRNGDLSRYKEAALLAYKISKLPERKDI